MSTWHANILTLYPDMFPGFLGEGVTGRGLREECWSLDAVNIRSFATDKHHTVDDTPSGGGPGMVMKPDIVDAAIAHVAQSGVPLIYMSPRGRIFDQAKAVELASGPGVTILCGRFEGVDQRVLDKWDIQELSLGDFVLSGGEPAAMAMLDACVRLLPGVLGASGSLDEESFSNGLLEYPQYTRPTEWEGRHVPDILLSGHHGKIAAWRRQQAEEVTQARRPDMWDRYIVSAKEILG